MHSYVSKVGLNCGTSKKKMDLMETAFSLAFKEIGSARYLTEVALSARARLTLPVAR